MAETRIAVERECVFVSINYKKLFLVMLISMFLNIETNAQWLPTGTDAIAGIYRLGKVNIGGTTAPSSTSPLLSLTSAFIASIDTTICASNTQNSARLYNTENIKHQTSDVYIPLLNKSTWKSYELSWEIGDVHKTTYSKDTLIGGILWSKYNNYISHVVNVGFLDTTLSIYNYIDYDLLYEDIANKKVFIKSATSDSLLLYLDFNSEINDSYFSYYFNDTIIAIDTFTIIDEDSIPHKGIKYLQNFPSTYFYHYIAEGVGVIDSKEYNGFPQEVKLGCFVQNGKSIYTQNLYPFYNINLLCDDYLNAINETDYYPIIIGPNPTASSFIIENISDINTVLMYDVTGKEIQPIRIKNTIDISNLAAGFYIVTCTDKNDKIFVGKIIKE